MILTVPVVPFEIEDGIEQVDPAGKQLDDNLLITRPVEFVRLNVIVSAACAAVARPSVTNKAATTKFAFFIMTLINSHWQMVSHPERNLKLHDVCAGNVYASA